MNKVNVNKVVDYANLLKENEKLHSIIKEVREYINSNLTISSILFGETTYCLNGYSFDYKELLKILDKVEENK